VNVDRQTRLFAKQSRVAAERRKQAVIAAEMEIFVKMNPIRSLWMSIWKKS
jgi:hypothetical protein